MGSDDVDGSPQRAYVRKAHNTAPGRRVTESIGVGCWATRWTSRSRSNPSRAGPSVTEDTEFVDTEREACGIAGGWQVQTAAGPTE